jgi:WD40 repeat protein
METVMPRTTFGPFISRVFLLLSTLVLALWTTTEATRADDQTPVPLVWKETAHFEPPMNLPVSVAYSPNGKLLIIGYTGGQVVAIDLLTRKERWKAEVGGNFAAVAFAADGKSILTTFEDGVRYLDVDTGVIRNFHIEPGSKPTAVGVFPDVHLDSGANQSLVSHKIIFGSARGWFVKIWTAGGFPSTISNPTVSEGGTPEDLQAVPLAVDPAGKCVVLTGPRRLDTGKNILWAWVAGDYGMNNASNRVLKGHQAVVVSAAWSRDGKVVATGDAAGSVILWDAKTMQPTDRLELGSRVAALALSPDGTRVAAVALGKRAEFYAWDKARPGNRKLIHVDPSTFAGPVHACLAFSPDGQHLAGSAISLAAPAEPDKALGRVWVWESGKP